MLSTIKQTDKQTDTTKNLISFAKELTKGIVFVYMAHVEIQNASS